MAEARQFIIIKNIDRRSDFPRDFINYFHVLLIILRIFSLPIAVKCKSTREKEKKDQLIFIINL